MARSHRCLYTSSGANQFVIYTATKIVYNIYFHPLSKFPGPKFAAATQIPVSYASWNGVNSQWLASLHEEYSSDVVRVAPDELSFISPSAWKDIYSHRPGHATFPKDVSQLVTIDNILTANDPDHSRIRRLFNQAFSEKAVREQEPLIKSHVNTLVDQLKKQDEGPARGKVDLAKWYVWTTFDVIGDLAFGESFDCLKENNFHPWVASLTVLLRTVVFASIASRFPLVGRILRLFVTKDMVQKREDHQRWSAEKVNRRIETGSSRPDLLSYVLPHADTKRGMTPEELHVNIRTFIVAGSDSTANMLNAATWFLVRHPSCLERATNEVREAFRSVHDITSRSVGKLEYLQAVIDESFRLHTATTAGQPRKAPGQGDTVSGYWVPGGVSKSQQFPSNSFIVKSARNGPDLLLHFSLFIPDYPRFLISKID